MGAKLDWVHRKTGWKWVSNLSDKFRDSRVKSLSSSASGEASPGWMDISQGRGDGVASSSSTTNSVGQSDDSDKPIGSITPNNTRARRRVGDLLDSLGEETTTEFDSTRDLPGEVPEIEGQPELLLLTGLQLSTYNDIEKIYSIVANNIKEMKKKGLSDADIAEKAISELQNSQLTIEQLNKLYSTCIQDDKQVFPGFKRRLLTSIEKSIINKQCDNIVFDIGATSNKTKRSDDGMKDAMFQYIVECMRKGGSMKEVSNVMGILREQPYQLELNTNDWLKLFKKYCTDNNNGENAELIGRLKTWLDALKTGGGDRIHIDCTASNAAVDFEQLTKDLQNSIAMQDNKFAAVAYYMVYNIVQKNSVDDITNHLMSLSQSISEKLSVDAKSFNQTFSSAQPFVLPEKNIQSPASNTPVEPEDHMRKTAVDQIGNFSPRQRR